MASALSISHLNDTPFTTGTHHQITLGMPFLSTTHCPLAVLIYPVDRGPIDSRLTSVCRCHGDRPSIRARSPSVSAHAPRAFVRSDAQAVAASAASPIGASAASVLHARDAPVAARPVETEPLAASHLVLATDNLRKHFKRKLSKYHFTTPGTHRNKQSVIILLTREPIQIVFMS